MTRVESPRTAAEHPGAVLRAARVAAGLTCAEVGRRTGYSASTVSRWETGRRRWTPDELRSIADALGVAPHRVGLAASEPNASALSVTVSPDNREGDDMRRRMILTGLTGLAAGAVIPSPAGATTMDDALYGAADRAPVALQQVDAAIAAARADLSAARYGPLSRRLPGVILNARTAATAADTSTRTAAHTRLSRAYALAAQYAIRVHDDSRAAITADRARHAAALGDNPIAAADAARVTATVLRRTPHPDRADTLLTDAAATLNDTTGLADANDAGMYAKLLCTAAYTAALRDDRDTALSLLAEAAEAFDATGSHDTQWLDGADLATYHISVHRALGDYGTALHYAHKINPSDIPTGEQRARYLHDTALAQAGRGRHDDAVDTLLTLDRVAPQEIRYRPWAADLTADLMTRTHRGDLRELDSRIRPRR